MANFPWLARAAGATAARKPTSYNWISQEDSLRRPATAPVTAGTGNQLLSVPAQALAAPVSGYRSPSTTVAPRVPTSGSTPGVGGVTGARQYAYTVAPTAVTTVKNDPLGGLHPDDLIDIMAQRRAITRALQGSERGYNTGILAADNDRSLDYDRAFQAAQGGANVARSGGSGGFNGSPATSGVGLAAVASGLAAEKAAAEQGYATATGALQRALQEAQAAYGAGNTDLAADIARRRNYANAVRKYT